MVSKLLRLVGPCALAAVCVPVASVWAQAADQGAASGQVAQASAQSGTATLGQLQEVVVTAERRATDVQQTPIAVTAVSGDQLQNLHLDNISDLQTTVPSFQSNDQGGYFNSINIRGMGNSAITPVIATGVAVFRDGILMSETIAEDEPMFDIADTEILEGPQGTFIGASSTAGAVEINSANPTFNGVNGYILASLANYSDTKWQGAVNLPATDTLAFRIAFNDEQRGSFYKDIGATLNGYFVNAAGDIQPMNQGTPAQSLPIIDPGHLNSRQARLSLLWKPTDSFQALGKAEYSFINTGGEPAQPNPNTYNTVFSAGPGPKYAGCSFAPAGDAFAGASGTQLICAGAGAPTHSTYYYPGETPRVLDYYGTFMQEDELFTRYGLELRYTLPDGIVLRSLSGFVHIDINHQPNLSYGPQNAGHEYHEIGPNDDYISEEVNVISPTTGKTNWIAGAFWNYRDTPVFTNTTRVNPPYQPYALPSTESFGASSTVNRIAAVFGQFNWQFTDTLQLQLGARENWDNNFVFQATNVAPARGTVLPAPFGTGNYAIGYTGTTPSSYTVLTQSRAGNSFKDSVPTGKIDLNWTPTPGQNFYAFYARGYKAGGANNGSSDHPTFQPEHVNDYELGWKGRIFNGHMLTQVGAYYINYQNMQYSLFDTQNNNDQSTGNYVANLAASTIYGIEIAEQSRFGGLGVNVGFDYNHSALGAIRAVPNYAFPAGFGGGGIALPQCLPGHTYAARTYCFDYTPYQVNVSGEENPFGPKITANISVDYQFHVGSGVIDPRVTFSHTDQQWDSIFQNTDYNLLQARNLWSASIDWTVGQWDTQLFGKNLTNATYIVGNGGGGSTVFYSSPRQMGVQLTRHF